MPNQSNEHSLIQFSFFFLTILLVCLKAYDASNENANKIRATGESVTGEISTSVMLILSNLLSLYSQIYQTVKAILTAQIYFPPYVPPLSYKRNYLLNLLQTSPWQCPINTTRLSLMRNTVLISVFSIQHHVCAMVGA